MKVFVICIAFGPTEQVEQSLLRFNEANLPMGGNFELVRVVVNGHFPMNYEKNQKGLEYAAFDNDFQFLDPGKDLGSAQSQNWALEKLGAKDGDYWVNLDPDSACDQKGWLEALFTTIERCPDIAILSCNTFIHWERIFRLGNLPVETRFEGKYRVLYPLAPELFNLSIWRVEALKKLGGIQQGTPFWGNVESLMMASLRQLNYRTAYLYDFMEATDLKLLQPMEFIDWKMRHGIKRDFPGSFTDYCKQMGLR